jgi:hypothetical protein
MNNNNEIMQINAMENENNKNISLDFTDIGLIQSKKLEKMSNNIEEEEKKPSREKTNTQERSAILDWLEEVPGDNLRLITGTSSIILVTGKPPPYTVAYSSLANYVNKKTGSSWSAKQAGARYKRYLKLYLDTKQRYEVDMEKNVELRFSTFEAKLEAECMFYRRLDKLFGSMKNLKISYSSHALRTSGAKNNSSFNISTENNVNNKSEPLTDISNSFIFNENCDDVAMDNDSKTLFEHFTLLQNSNANIKTNNNNNNNTKIENLSKIFDNYVENSTIENQKLSLSSNKRKLEITDLNNNNDNKNNNFNNNNNKNNNNTNDSFKSKNDSNIENCNKNDSVFNTATTATSSDNGIQFQQLKNIEFEAQVEKIKWEQKNRLEDMHAKANIESMLQKEKIKEERKTAVTLQLIQCGKTPAEINEYLSILNI